MNEVKTQVYLTKDGFFEVECPFCFARCYCYEDGQVVCEENAEHVFSLGAKS